MSLRERIRKAMNYGKEIVIDYEPTTAEEQWHNNTIHTIEEWDELWTSEWGWWIDAGGNVHDCK